jgi:hypothetical protein
VKVHSPVRDIVYCSHYGADRKIGPFAFYGVFSTGTWETA